MKNPKSSLGLCDHLHLEKKGATYETSRFSSKKWAILKILSITFYENHFSRARCETVSNVWRDHVRTHQEASIFLPVILHVKPLAIANPKIYIEILPLEH